MQQQINTFIDACSLVAIDAGIMQPWQRACEAQDGKLIHHLHLLLLLLGLCYKGAEPQMLAAGQLC